MNRIVNEPLLRDLVNVGRRNKSTVSGSAPESQIVDQHDQDIRRSLRRLHRLGKSDFESL
jgi:hypothetical protein